MWGNFEDLLMATAKSPAMLFYLDNALSVADAENRPPLPKRARASYERALDAMDPDMAKLAKENAPRGINENYAREIMELHTLGVDGGYTQKDVTELARALTGWSSAGPGTAAGEAEAEFVFRARMHDIGSKTIPGHTPAGRRRHRGRRGDIRLLAHHPATPGTSPSSSASAVADDPPGLPSRVARVFLRPAGTCARPCGRS
jgi:uncharacterized protein (DUF1800 family)